jgi:hypothetical protein
MPAAAPIEPVGTTSVSPQKRPLAAADPLAAQQMSSSNAGSSSAAGSAPVQANGVGAELPAFSKTMRVGVCHGRVPEQDFEKMVPAQWWKSVFADALYLKTDGDVVEDPEITKEEIR